MEEVLKQDKNRSHKEFEKLLAEDLGNRKFKEGEIATGIVEEIGKKWKKLLKIKKTSKELLSQNVKEDLL